MSEKESTEKKITPCVREILTRTKMAKKCPVLEGGSEITVFETFSVM